MKKKQILMSLLVLMVAGFATGCKNQSKSIEAPIKPPVVKPDVVKEESNFEKAVRVKKELEAAGLETVAVKKAHEDAIANREELKAALDGQPNTSARIGISKDLDMAILAVSELEVRVSLYQGKMKDKRALLEALKVGLTETELYKIGEKDIEIEVTDEEKRLEAARARLEMSYDAVKASVLDTKKLLDSLESQILDREQKLVAFSVPGETSALAVIKAEIDSLNSMYTALMGKLRIETANQDVLARALEEVQ